MHQHSTILTTVGIEKLREQFSRLKERYEHITEDLREKTQSHNVLAVKRIEREVIFSDMVKMETILSHATILEEATPHYQAEQGAKVTYLQQNTGKEHTITLVDPLEADPLEGYVSVQSPVGSTLLGRQVGDSVAITTPKGGLYLTITSLK